MTLYSVALFAHVAGAVLFFAALALRGLRRAAAISQVADWAGAARLADAEPAGLADQCVGQAGGRRAGGARRPVRAGPGQPPSRQSAPAMAQEYRFYF